ncbi:MAG: DUF2322 family protein [Methylophilaceae bacterium]|uniref:DUF2322 family protein n=1 Tax=Methylovorus sp. MM2 TaxID=1848038 RepID=UPI0007DF8B4F|nr:DUF2322 family protein [Methylovorus sp. MM2]OAM51628.1 hypothetical protein A7981_09130 [Methylovorus sp. MM2]
MTKFSEILATLEPADHVQKIELFNPDGTQAGLIENKPGSQGSIKVYHHLWKKYGSINTDAAKDGLVIYAEHTSDAESNAGKHPNIDRLFTVIKSNNPLTVKIDI